MSHSSVSRPKQADFLNVPEVIIVYYISEEILKLLTHCKKLHEVAEVRQGLATANDERFLRYTWEVLNVSERWVTFTKGGGYCKWFGKNWYHNDWEFDGARIKAFPKSFIRNSQYYFKSGWSYSLICRGSLSFRYFDMPGCIGHKGPGIYASNRAIAALMQSRFISFALRAISPQLAFEVNTLASAPLPKQSIELFSKFTGLAETYKRLIIASNPLERSFYSLNYETKEQSYAAWLHTVEGLTEEKVCKAYSLSQEAIKNITDDTGIPAGWFPLISNYDTLPELPPELPEIPPELIDYLQTHHRLTLSPDELTDIKRRLRSLYEAGSGAKVEDEEIDIDTPTDDEEDEETEEAVGAHIPIPTETFLEELSVKLEIHPISVYWLLKEGREHEGWRCIPEEKRFTEDTFTVMVLRLLGHQWPKQIEAGEPVPDWADKDGIIPISIGAGEKTLIERVRDRIAAEFPNGNITSIEREFTEIVGISLEKWLTGAFCKRHISQFKKRPIAWQIESSSPSPLRRGGKGVRLIPAFSCLVYYHQLDGDLLPKLRTQYVGPLRSRYETELRTLEGILNDERTTDQASRILQLQNSIVELKAFDEQLSEVATSGFSTNKLHQFAIDDATFCMKARWLRKLAEEIAKEPLEKWKQDAIATNLHPDFPTWIADALNHLDYYCTVVGVQPPNPKSQDPTTADLAEIICKEAKSMVKDSLSLACKQWWAKFDEALIAPLRQLVKDAEAETKQLKEFVKQLGTKKDNTRRDQINLRLATLKAETKDLKQTIVQRTTKGEAIRQQIEAWKCPAAETWEPWLASQAMYDAISSIDGHRTPPQTVAEFVAQESAYVPDLNDGVRVNVVPLQKAGLLTADVLAKKDVEKAIGDRAEWRADERRWCREGKLPQPGWWLLKKDKLQQLR